MPLPYFGGKGKVELGGWLFKHFDLNGITNYCEPFSGMFGIYLGNFSDFSEVKKVIYNDIDKQNCNVFNCCKVPILFIDEIHKSLQPGGIFYTKRGTSYQEKYDHYKSIYLDYHNGIKVLPKINLLVNDYQSAVIYSFLRLTSSNQMHFLTCGFKNFTLEESWYKRYKVFQPLMNKLSDPDFCNKLARINPITAFDFEIVMNKYSNSKSFIYLDPPYYDRELLYDPDKTGVFTVKDHQRLANAVNQSKARIAISYYYFDEISNLYPPKSKGGNFTYLKKEVRNNAAGKNAEEVLILNY